ncbi:M56 family metallopeptidase [Leeuwenhoekiella polynyae]|uniref:Outer membrane transport energization protein TonB n=1 Tax=Leeuwenhoekiella polynyae TaxID=1550906 RepID=A0A4Q0P1S7_9FLAO|nr:M56 family metallopeptidase [Leeuwenhoekiella polynyae]RXG18616.1 outer membrane transport energization protein TonB [Leeuwenhoekiella polynyae]
MVRYLLEVFVIQALFLSVYQFWLRKETFFNVNRLYLIGSVLLAFALPFMQFEFFQNQIPLRENIQVLPEVIIGVQPVNAAEILAPQKTNWPFIALLIYCSGLLFALLLFIRKYLKISCYYKYRKVSGQKVITVPDSDIAFTFLNTIFIGDNINDEAKKHILAHEEVHLKEKHGFDLLVFEILRLVFWFNPLVYIYQTKIAELHEFIADAHATQTTEKKVYYNQLLNSAFGTQHISFINTFFNHSLIKKRILMLQKQSKSKAKWKYLLLLPLVAGVLTYVGCTNDTKTTQSAAKEDLEMQIVALKDELKAKANPSQEELKELKKLEDQYRDQLDLAPTLALNELVMVGYRDVSNEAEQTQNATPESKQKESIKLNEPAYAASEIPVAFVDEVPVFTGCEGLNNQERLECMSSKMNQLVNINFNSGLGEELKLEGVNRIYVRFVIDAQGKVTKIGTRADYPELEQEAKRVISTLPKMTPATQLGEPVAIQYSLPITFVIRA